MNTGSLLLHPASAPSHVDPGRTLDLLRELCFIAEPLQGDGNAYLIGAGFLQLITFMGCSPHIEVEPPADGGMNFCHVELHWMASPRLMFGANTRPPRCPVCRKAMNTPASSVASATRLHCPHCGSDCTVESLLWRRDAGFADCFIEVHSVFPGEAVPTEGLLRRLQSLGGGDWGYFYLTRS